MQEISTELIEQFFKGQCTREEAVAVLDFIKKNPNHPYLFKEWQAADETTSLPSHYTLDMYDAVVAHMGNEETAQGRLKLWWRIAAAACVISIFISLWLTSIETNTSGSIKAAIDTAAVEWIERRNTQDTAIALQLPDKSTITLSRKAWVRYRKDFATASRRDVYLKGQAFFDVAENKDQPFTVYSGFISTTVLGTAFHVTASVDGNTMKVQLQEGKVRISVTDSTVSKLHTDYYLLPGQEITFTGKTRAGVIRPYE